VRVGPERAGAVVRGVGVPVVAAFVGALGSACPAAPPADRSPERPAAGSPRAGGGSTAGPPAGAPTSPTASATSTRGASTGRRGPPAGRTGGPPPPAARRRLRVVFWNVQNLFHPSATGPGRKSKMPAIEPAAYADRLGRLARGLATAGRGQLPGVVALAEVGRAPALADLAGHPELAPAAYRAVRLAGPDRRGIGNAVLTRWPLAAPPRHHVVHRANERPTRAVLEVRLEIRDRILVVFVNHWPSKRGAERARRQRERIARRVAALVRATADRHPNHEIVVLGDFNAHLDERVFDAGYLDASAVEDDVRTGAALLFHTIDDAAEAAFGTTLDDLDAVRRLERRRGGFGTHVYRARWATLDGILVHASLLDRRGLAYVPDSAEIVRAPNLIYVMHRGRRDAYEKPDRETSDHLPVAVELAPVRH